MVKVTKKEPEFKPVHIILESQDEVDFMTTLLGRIKGRSAISQSLFNEIGNYARSYSHRKDKFFARHDLIVEKDWQSE